MTQDFNNQNNNLISNNQTALNQQPTNNINRQMSFNHPAQPNNVIPNSPKKNNLGLLAGIVILVVAVIVGCILIFGGESKSKTQSEEEKQKENIKPITYLNPSTVNVTDKLAITLEQSSENGKGVLFGISDKGAAENLKIGDHYLGNNIFMVSTYDKNDEFSVKYNDINFAFELESQYYVKNENTETLDGDQIVYKENNYIVTSNNINSYTLYYLFDEKYYNSYDDNKKTGTWSIINISFPATLEKAKERIKEIENNMDVCIYNKKDGYNSCLQNQKDKNYKHLSDVLVDTLMDYNLYVDSYENIKYIDNAEITFQKYVTFDGIDEDDYTEFEMNFYTNDLNETEVTQKTTLNGKEVKITKYHSLYYANFPQESGYLKMLIDLPYGVEENDENVIKSITETFSKTK